MATSKKWYLKEYKYLVKTNANVDNEGNYYTKMKMQMKVNTPIIRCVPISIRIVHKEFVNWIRLHAGTVHMINYMRFMAFHMLCTRFNIESIFVICMLRPKMSALALAIGYWFCIPNRILCK